MGDAASAIDAASASAWLAAHAEDHTPTGPAADLNQYWYSAGTVAKLCSVVRQHALSLRAERLACAFVSTPSIFFALSAAERGACRVLDFDEALGEGEPGFVAFDYNHPEAIPSDLRGAFEMVVIDPPYITADVWRRYIEAARLLLREGGLVVATTVIENAPLLADGLGVRPHVWLPSIPHLPYQYAVYTNFDSPLLASPNPEVPDHDPAEFLKAATASDGGVTRGGEAEDRPIGGRAAYDFDEMVRRAEAEEAARGAA